MSYISFNMCDTLMELSGHVFFTTKWLYVKYGWNGPELGLHITAYIDISTRYHNKNRREYIS